MGNPTMLATTSVHRWSRADRQVPVPNPGHMSHRSHRSEHSRQSQTPGQGTQWISQEKYGKIRVSMSFLSTSTRINQVFQPIWLFSAICFLWFILKRFLEDWHINRWVPTAPISFVILQYSIILLYHGHWKAQSLGWVGRNGPLLWGSS